MTAEVVIEFDVVDQWSINAKQVLQQSLVTNHIVRLSAFKVFHSIVHIVRTSAFSDYIGTCLNSKSAKSSVTAVQPSAA